MEKELTIRGAESILDSHYPMSRNRVLRMGYDGFTYSRVTGYAIFNGICVYRKEEDVYIFQEITILRGGNKNEK